MLTQGAKKHVLAVGLGLARERAAEFLDQGGVEGGSHEHARRKLRGLDVADANGTIGHGQAGDVEAGDSHRVEASAAEQRELLVQREFGQPGFYSTRRLCVQFGVMI